MNVANSKLNSLHKRSKSLAVLAGLLCITAATVGSLALCSCAHTEKGLARETEIHNVASNTIAVLQPVVQAAPAPINTILGTVFAGLSGLLAVWATHIHRSVAELKKTNGNGTPAAAPPVG
jgi:hypothetical protein